MTAATRAATLGLVVALAACGGRPHPARLDGKQAKRTAGGLIAYTAADGIHLVTPDGRNDWTVPRTGDLSGPRWSPDGHRFAAVDLADCCKAYSVSMDGIKRRLPANSDTTPDWSPDGRRLATVGNDRHIHIVSIADGRTEAVIPKSGNDPVWSPDGRTIAFQGRDAAGILRIFLAAPTVRELRRVTAMNGGKEGEVEAAWSPDGRRLAFASDADGDYDLYVVRVDGSGLRKLSQNSADDGDPSWAPDGSQLVFDRIVGDTTAIVAYDLKTRKERILAKTNGYSSGKLVYEPSWRPSP